MTLPDPLSRADAPTLTEFLMDRIAEDEAEVDHPLFEASTARVLAECEAKRRIVDLHGLLDGGYDADGIERPGLGCRVCVDDYPCETLKHLGTVYSGHPAYRAEWKP